MNVGAIASSCHSPSYVAWAREYLGPANERALAEDARTLANVATTHDAFARLQLLAFLFADAGRARASANRDLSELRVEDVDDATGLEAARAVGAPAEIARAATELELSLVASLPPPAFDRDATARALDRMTELVPELARFEIRMVRALGVRGRAYPRVILVGTPGIAGADPEHVAWQAAHEALVAAQPRGMSFIDVERSAIGTLRARARNAGLGDDHTRWLGRFDVSALGSIPDVADGT